MSDPKMVVLKTTFPDREKAETISCLLVDAGLAAAAQVAGEVLTITRFQSTLLKEKEIPVSFLVLPARLDLFLGELKLQHPAKIPQIVKWPGTQVDKTYLDRVIGKTS